MKFKDGWSLKYAAGIRKVAVTIDDKQVVEAEYGGINRMVTGDFCRGRSKYA